MLRSILAQQLDKLWQSGYLESVATEKRFAIAGTGEQRAKKGMSGVKSDSIP
jgi:hypothetical protein